jgi:hypothetical protein
MSGLYTRSNLSEDGLNASEALQKLYSPQIQNDINLFAYASVLQSQISSPTNIFGLLNSPISDLAGLVSYRTKFLTNSYTFSNNNEVWFERVEIPLDRRTSTELDGADLRYSVNGSVANVAVRNFGEGYYVVNSAGDEVSTYPATVDVRVIGTISYASDAVVRITVNSDGTIGGDISVIDGGTGYTEDEPLELMPLCQGQETELLNRCVRYTSANSLVQINPSTLASIQNTKYTYTVKFSDSNGFFLYDTLSSKWLYLGSFYNTIDLLTGTITLNRSDRIEPENLGKLYNLNAQSFFYDYRYAFRTSDNLFSTLTSLTDTVEVINNDLLLFAQNSRPYRFDTDPSNPLGVTYNVFEGRNVNSDYRMVFRDPDGVLDQESIDFFTIRDTLSGQNNYRVGDVAVPGIWLFAGDKYQRAFSSDDKPFFSSLGRNYLSPALYDTSGNELSESGQLKYSISASYRNSVSGTIRGFDTEIGTLVQTISSTTGRGGFVYHRPLTVTTTSGISSWPILSYTDSSGFTRDAKFLAI